MKWKLFAVLFILIGTLTLSSFTFLQRGNPQHDLVFYTESKHDALWHLALMSAIQRSVPPQNPLIGDRRLVGYHYFNDAVWVLVQTVTGIPLTMLYLQVVPILLACLFVSTSLGLFLKIFRNKIIAFLGASITVFGAGFSYLAPIFFPTSKVGLSVFWLDQTIHLGINQQLLLSLSIVNIILFFFFKSYSKHWKLIGILVGGVIAIKVYAGLILLGVLSVIAIYSFVRTKDVVLLKILGLSLVISVPMVLMIGSSGGFPFIWEPGFFFKTMFETGDRLNYPRWEQIRVDAVMHQSWHRLIILWSVAIGIFFVGNFGLKLAGFFASSFVIARTKKEEKLFWQMLFLILLLCFAMPTLFLQKGIVWNTIQFLPYAFVPLGLFLTKSIELVKVEMKWKIAALVLILVISLPSTIQAFVGDFSPTSYSTISTPLIQQVEDLGKEYPDKRILLHANLQNDSLIPAFAGRGVYFTNQAVIRIMGNTYEERRTYIEDVQKGITECESNEIFVSLLNKSNLKIESCPRTFRFDFPQNTP